MKINSGKLIIVYCVFCVMLMNGLCFHKHIQMLTIKVSELFGKKTCSDEKNALPECKINHNKPNVVSQSNDSENEKQLRSFGTDWNRISTEITNNWWIIALSLLLPLMVFWRIQYKMRKRLQEWKKMFIQKEKAYDYSRRLTLPDLTLAKHARRESLAEATLKSTNHPRKMSLSNSSQLRNMKQNLFERNDDTPGEIKRAHIIRRRH